METQKLSSPQFLLFVLILPAVVIFGASSVTANSVRHTFDQRVNAYFVRDYDDLKSDKKLSPGKFLVAARRLEDPNFRETVVLLIHYGSDGAVGLVINRPAQLELSTILPDVKELDRMKETLYLGGPVEPNMIMLLVKSANPSGSSMPVFDDVYLSASRDELQRLVKKPDKEERFRIYAGYAGWAPQQLESEYDRGHWHVLKADAQTLFDRKPSEIWQELIHRASVKWVRTMGPGKMSYETQIHPHAKVRHHSDLGFHPSSGHGRRE